MKTKVSIQKLEHGCEFDVPAYATPLSAGLDLQAAITDTLDLQPMERAMIPTGMAIALPAGFEAQIRSRSGLSAKHGLIVLNAPGTIDADYRGEIKIVLMNLGSEPVFITRGMRIAQMVIARHERIEWEECDALDAELCRGGGFGSTGV